jgi:hypothetical protein
MSSRRTKSAVFTLRKLAMGLSTLVLVLAFCESALAAPLNHWEKRGYFSMRLGFLYSGRAKIDGGRYDLDPGFTFGVGCDLRVQRHMFWSVSCDIDRMYMYNIGQYFLDVSTGIKYRHFGRSSQVAFQPGLFVGYGRLAVVRLLDVVYLEPSSYATLKANLEIIFFSRSQAAFFGEVGVFWAPVGGNHEHTIRIGPMAILRGGMML